MKEYTKKHSPSTRLCGETLQKSLHPLSMKRLNTRLYSKLHCHRNLGRSVYIMATLLSPQALRYQSMIVATQFTED
ncbi:hypothetical protein [Desulfurococcus amylolyticus]|uniref:hypothetical protein n=1 Tax=Desulfurococcus amylolyticus TaxID=94694 RepID=UPI0012EC49A3|nr:hypothetical protein [Desulfurococcus amylolyticus]